MDIEDLLDFEGISTSVREEPHLLASIAPWMLTIEVVIELAKRTKMITARFSKNGQFQ
jgi:hypothetical protein